MPMRLVQASQVRLLKGGIFGQEEDRGPNHLKPYTFVGIKNNAWWFPVTRHNRGINNATGENDEQSKNDRTAGKRRFLQLDGG
jgi:hypothetical protein